MLIREKLKNFAFIFLKSLNPKYYKDLKDNELGETLVYFFAIILASFIVMSVLALPKLYVIKSDLDKSILDIAKLDIDAELETEKPILLPRNNPIITLDTTGNKTMDTEIFLITDKTLFYNFFNKQEQIGFNGYKFTDNKEQSGKFLTFALLLMLPGIALFYYLAYAIKYFILIIALAVVSYAVAKTMKNSISPKQALVLSFYTSTVMIVLEILTIPFFIKDYMFTYSPFVGISFSAIAMTIYLTLYITSIRIIGSKNLKY